MLLFIRMQTCSAMLVRTHLVLVRRREVLRLPLLPHALPHDEEEEPFGLPGPDPVGVAAGDGQREGDKPGEDCGALGREADASDGQQRQDGPQQAVADACPRCGGGEAELLAQPPARDELVRWQPLLCRLGYWRFPARWPAAQRSLAASLGTAALPARHRSRCGRRAGHASSAVGSRRAPRNC